MKYQFISTLLILTFVCYLHSSTQASNINRTVEVPFDFYRNIITVQVKVNGKGSYNMMLDTGTNPSLIDLKTSKELGLEIASVGRHGRGGGAGVNLMYETKLPLLELGGLRAQNVAALALDLSKTSAALGKPVHGVLGHSLLNGRVVQIDYPHRVLRFYSRSPLINSAVRTDKTKLTKLHFHYRKDVLIETAMVNDKKVVANIDTGSNSTFQLTPAAVRDLGLEAEVGKARASRSVGFNGVSQNREGTVKSVTVGGITVDGPPVVFFGKGMGSDREDWGLNIGNAFLKDFVVTIDYPNKVIVLQKP